MLYFCSTCHNLRLSMSVIRSKSVFSWIGSPVYNELLNAKLSLLYSVIPKEFGICSSQIYFISSSQAYKNSSSQEWAFLKMILSKVSAFRGLFSHSFIRKQQTLDLQIMVFCKGNQGKSVWLYVLWFCFWCWGLNTLPLSYVPSPFFF